MVCIWVVQIAALWSVVDLYGQSIVTMVGFYGFYGCHFGWSLLSRVCLYVWFLRLTFLDGLYGWPLWLVSVVGLYCWSQWFVSLVGLYGWSL